MWKRMRSQVLVLAALVVFVATATNNCSFSDYRMSAGACNTKTKLRPISYALPTKNNKFRSPSCMGKASLSWDASATCACLLEDLVPQFKQHPNSNEVICINNKATIEKVTTKGDCTVEAEAAAAMKAAIGTRVPCECTEEDVDATFTECVNGTRSLVFFWKRACTNTKGLVLPDAQLSPCTLHCGDGEVLAPPHPVCHKCPAGTYSVAGDQYQSPYHTGELPPHIFNTFCRRTPHLHGCNAWQVSSDGAYFYSGDNKQYANVTSVLTMTVDVVSYPAMLKFKIHIDSEKDADHFALMVDGNLRLSGSGNEPWQSAQVDIMNPCDDTNSCKIDEKKNDVTLCPWTINGKFCIHSNELTPFNPATFFSRKRSDTNDNEDSQSSYDITDAVVLVDPCNDIAFSPGGARAVFVDGIGNASACKMKTRLQGAQKAGVRILFLPDDTIDDGRHIFGENYDIETLKVGWLKKTDILAIKNIILKKTESLHVRHHPSPGRQHVIQFAYLKDASVTVGRDRVMLKDIEISGTKFAPTKCHKCPPGTGSKPASSECHRCPAGSYASEWGTEYPCHPCGGHETSTPGATKCNLMLGCGPEDYRPVHGWCQKGVDGKLHRVVDYEAVLPPVCDPAIKEYKKPIPTTVECPPCSDGMMRNTVTGACERCPVNQVTTLANRSCHHCPAGQTPVFGWDFDSFDDFEGEFPPQWSTKCDSCFGSAWALSTYTGDGSDKGSSVLITGRSAVPGSTSEISAMASFNTNAYVEFSYYISYPRDYPAELRHYSFEFTIWDLEEQRELETFVLPVPTQDGPNKIQMWRTTDGNTVIPEGDYNLTWRYVKKKEASPSAVVFMVLKSLTVKHLTQGVGSGCQSCPVGHRCPHGIAEKCEPGTFVATMGATKCASCKSINEKQNEPDEAKKEGSTGFVAAKSASTKCTPCAHGMVANTKATACILPKGCMLRIGEPKVKQDLYPDQPFGTGKQLDSVTGVRPSGRPINSQMSVFDLSYFHEELRIDTQSGSNQVSGAHLSFNLCETDSHLPCIGEHEVASFGCTKSRSPAETPNNGNALPTMPGPTNATRESRSLGHLIDFRGIFSKATNDTEGFIATISGAKCTTDPKRDLTTEVRVTCDVNEFDTVTRAQYFTCKNVIEMKSRYACPQCTNESYVYIDAPCDSAGNHHRVFHYSSLKGVPLAGPACFGGVPLPRPREVQCPWAVITLPKEVNSVWIIVLSVLLLILLLSIIACYMYRSRQALKNRYTQLQNSTFQDVAAMGDFNSSREANEMQQWSDEQNAARRHAPLPVREAPLPSFGHGVDLASGNTTLSTAQTTPMTSYTNTGTTVSMAGHNSNSGAATSVVQYDDVELQNVNGNQHPENGQEDPQQPPQQSPLSDPSPIGPRPPPLPTPVTTRVSEKRTFGAGRGGEDVDDIPSDA